jgi:hypothetical protein
LFIDNWEVLILFCDELLILKQLKKEWVHKWYFYDSNNKCWFFDSQIYYYTLLFNIKFKIEYKCC